MFIYESQPETELLKPIVLTLLRRIGIITVIVFSKRELTLQVTNLNNNVFAGYICT